jgi:hypothetical protein
MPTSKQKFDFAKGVHHEAGHAVVRQEDAVALCAARNIPHAATLSNREPHHGEAIRLDEAIPSTVPSARSEPGPIEGRVQAAPARPAAPIRNHRTPGAPDAELGDGAVRLAGHGRDSQIDLSRLQDTTRTRGLRLTSKLLISLAHPTRFERVTFAFGGQRSPNGLRCLASC